MGASVTYIISVVLVLIRNPVLSVPNTSVPRPLEPAVSRTTTSATSSIITTPTIPHPSTATNTDPKFVADTSIDGHVTTSSSTFTYTVVTSPQKQANRTHLDVGGITQSGKQTSEPGTTLAEDDNMEEPETENATETRSATENIEIILEDSRVKTTPRQLVKCQCGAREVLTKDGCQHYPGDTFVYGEGKHYKRTKVPVASLDVVVHEPQCKNWDGHLQMNFTGEQFYLRRRGDVVLTGSVGHLFGLRINNYCVTHYMDDGGHITWRMKKACVPPPSVPRCCPPGEAMEGDQCRPATSPSLLTPPISADIFKPAVPWPVIKNHVNTINCTNDPVKSIPIEPKVSYLLTVPTGMVHIWSPGVSYINKKYTYPNDFCVEGRETHGGVVKYSVKICYTDPLENHHKTCYGHTCVRKCCPYGQVMDTSLYRCAALENSTFRPPFTTEPLPYKIVIGVPLCTIQTKKNNFSINARGQLYYGDRIFPPTRYCTDLFHDGKGNIHDGALVCVKNSSVWNKARNILFLVCQMISLLFLAVTVVCYWLVPVLLERGGWCQLFHAISLMVAYSATFLHNSIGHSWDDPTCIAMAIVMQFGFLSTFFWLSVLCFDVLRKIRSLNHFLPAFDPPLWAYMLFAFGGPCAISILTLCMQFFAPDDVVGVIKPHLADTRCWFPDTKELLLYFYGPIAFLFTCNFIFIGLTYWNYRQIVHRTAVLRTFEGEKPDSEATKALSTTDHSHRWRDCVADFKQQFSLLVLMSTCWATEVLSWKIPPPELWILTNILNTLQGFFVFVIFVTNRNNRNHLKRKFFTVKKYTY